MALLEARDIEKTYYSDGVATPVLHGISLTVATGEFVAIMGPSGSGKSTLLHILGFLDPQTAGEYFFDGKSIHDYSEPELAHVRNKKMGFVFQAFDLLPRATVLENVMLPLLYAPMPPAECRERATHAVESVGLGHRMAYEAARLSGGEKQRAAIARALVNSPQVIFADEPTGNLDSKSGMVVMEILQKLNEEQRHTVLLITHETYTAEHAARIIHLKDGTIESDTRVARRLTAKDGLLK